MSRRYLLTLFLSGVSPVPTVAQPQTKRIIRLWMNGGPSQADTFDPKLALDGKFGLEVKDIIA